MLLSPRMYFWFLLVSLVLLPSALFADENPSDLSPGASSWPGSESLFAPEELEWLGRNQALAYVYDPDWAPFEWKDDSGEHSGIIADILELINTRSGIEFEPVNTDTWEESVALVKSGKADMFSAITINSDREKYLEFTSRDIYSYPAVLIARFDDKTVYLNIDTDFKGKKIGIVKGSGLGQYIKENHPQLEYVYVPATRDGFSFLQKNKIDLFAINTVTGRYYIEKKGFSGLKIALKLDYIYRLKIAIRKDMPGEIISILDKTLGSIREEELDEIFHKWIEAPVKKQTDWKLLFRITGALFILVLVLYELKRIQTSKELKQKVSDLDVALKQVQQANNAKSVFLANVSHEIRTPMNGVLGMVQVLRRTDLNEEQELYIETLERSSNLLLSLINDILDLSKIESGELALIIKPFETIGWITDIQNLIEPLFENKETIFSTEVSESLPAYMDGDVIRLLQIVVNLLSNAAKYTAVGEVKLTVGGEFINEDQFNLLVTVKDTGVGIPDHKLSHIFDAFHQLKADRTINQGVGLGLAICKRLSDIMGGRLQVASRLGEGSCFTFSAILSVPKENFDVERRQEEAGINRELSILLVDDDRISRYAARTLLEEEGHRIAEAENGKIAIEKIEHELFDLILMDIHMPVMDGVSATRKIREGKTEAKQIPIIGITASVMKDEEDSYIRAGMNAVVAKPIHIEELLKTIQKML